MTNSEINITRVVRSRGVAWLMMLSSVIAVWMARQGGLSLTPDVDSCRGLLFSVPDMSGAGSALPFAINMSGNAVIVILMLLINRWFNIIRSVSWLFVGVFMVMQASVPSLMAGFGSGTLLCIIVLTALTAIYTVYLDPERTRRVFLAFFLLGSGSFIEYACLAYIPIMLVGCVQMRAFTLRSLMAALAGILTPLWILWGFGIASINDIDFLGIRIDLSMFSQQGFIPIVSSAGVTLLAGLIFGFHNLVKVYSYNARSRAFNGLLAIMSIATGLLCIADIGSLATYLPLLNCCVAFQVGMFFRIKSQNRAYLPVLILIAIYIMLYTWSVCQ